MAVHLIEAKRAKDNYKVLIIVENKNSKPDAYIKRERVMYNPFKYICSIETPNFKNIARLIIDEIKQHKLTHHCVDWDINDTKAKSTNSRVFYYRDLDIINRIFNKYTNNPPPRFEQKEDVCDNINNTVNRLNKNFDDMIRVVKDAIYLQEHKSSNLNSFI
jgi:hypothetical protein